MLISPVPLFLLLCLLLNLLLFMLNVVSLNCKGLRDNAKRQALFLLLKSKNIDIIFLQETHVDCLSLAKQYSNEWGGKCYFSFGGFHSSGVGILFRKNFAFQEKSFQFDNDGRLLCLNIIVNNECYKLVNIYAPNNEKDRKLFFNSLDTVLQGKMNKILCGDFNMVENIALDKIGGNLTRGNVGSDIINNIKCSFSLVDAFRKLNPKKVEFSFHHSSQNISLRLDRFYISQHMIPQVHSVTHEPCTLSDHDLVVLMLNTCGNQGQVHGPGFWHCNTNILGSQELQSEMEDLWYNNLNLVVNKDCDWWDQCKLQFKELLIKHSKKAASDTRAQIKQIENEIRHLQSLTDVITGTNIVYQDEIESLKAEMNNLLYKKVEGAKVRSKIKYLKDEEKPTRYFLKKEIKRGEKKLLTKLNVNNTTVTDQNDIIFHTREFYSSLYSKHDSNPNLTKYFLSDVPQLNETDKELCEGPISVGECNAALKLMQNDKSPGLDGLPKEFYIQFFYLFGPSFVNVVNNCMFVNKCLGSSQRQGIITLMCKNNNEPELLSNWRPLSLMNVDYKIIAKVLMLRLRKVISSIVHIDQTCSVPGRSILDNAHLLRCIQDYVEQKNIPCALVSLDLVKAFDHVSHDFLFKALQAYNFGPSFIQWIKTMYFNCQSQVLVNGFLSAPFPIERGVRQGCPMSPLLYALFIEPFARKIRSDPYIEGLKLPGTPEEARISQYSDDNNFIVTSRRSIVRIFDIVKLYSMCAGTKLNLSKCCGVWMGKWKHCTDHICGISWSNSIVKIVGIYYGNENTENVNWNYILGKFCKIISEWESRNITMKGKAVLLNSCALSKLWYTGSVMPLPADFVSKFSRKVFKFVWGNKPECVKRNTLIGQSAQGGIDLIDIKLKIQALQVVHLRNVISQSQAKYKYFAMYWCGLSLRKYIPMNNSVPHSLDYVPQFYKECLSSLNHVLQLKPDFDLEKSTTKEIYNILRNSVFVPPKVQENNVYCHISFKSVWANINDAFIEPIHRDTAWRIAHNVLPVHSYLYKINVTNDPTCILCNNQVETFSHLFFNCTVVKPSILYIDQIFTHMLGHNYQLTENAIVFNYATPTGYIFTDKLLYYMISCIKHIIWRKRNSMKHDRINVSSNNILYQFKNELKHRCKTDYQRLNNDCFRKYWCKNEVLCTIADNSLVLHI